MKQVLYKIINTDQTGYIKNRYIGFNLRQIQDIIDYADKFNIDGAILFLDFSKAFDSLDWDFMYETLDYFGFENGFIQWIKTLYSDIGFSIFNNGWLSAPVKPQRGIRQGCPCSSLTFVLCVEIMANQLRNNGIKGIEIKLEGKTHKLIISQLADDTTLFLKSKEEIKKALNIIETFGTYSGLKLNKTKTEGIWIGKLKKSKDKIDNINFTDKPIKVLGIYFGLNKEECDKLNWDSKMHKAKNLMKSWEKRHLTIMGKILIIKTLIIPQFTYIASVTLVSKERISELENEIYRFIWNGKRDKVKRQTLIADFERGGLNMVDIKSYFKALTTKWAQFLLKSKEENWTVIPKFYLNYFGENLLILHMNTDKKTLNSLPNFQNLPKFYQEIILCWHEYNQNTKEITNFRDARKEIIWGNKHIKFKNKPLLMMNWIKAGLIHINDILDGKGEISEHFILDKLKSKSNWLSELAKIKSAIPKEWKILLNTENSRKTKIHIKNDNHCQNEKLTNKTIYKKFLDGRILPNLGFEIWKKKISVDSSQICSSMNFIFKGLVSNKLKVFRWKLLSYILPNEENLFKWKIGSSPNCSMCKINDNYQHFFIECKILLEFWEIIESKLKILNFTNKINLKDIVFGYKICDREYDSYNTIITLIAFTIYKRFYMSDHRKKCVDTYSIFKKEITDYIHISENNSLVSKFINIL